MRFSKFGFNLQSRLSSIYCQARQHWRDLLLLVVIAGIGGFLSYQGARLIDPLIFYIDDVWFESDMPRVFSNMLFWGADHSRTQVHPLFSLVAFPPVYVLRTALGIAPFAAIRIVIATVASLWMGALFVLLRLVGCRRFDATLFSLLAASSAAAMFWFVVPETYSFGSLSLLLALDFVALTQYRKFSSWWYVAVSALTLSFTTTNWMAGILATIVNHPWKRSLQITVKTFCLVSLLWAVQKVIFPSAKFFLGIRQEKQFILKPESGGALQVFKNFVSHTMVMPTINVIEKFTPTEKVLSIQSSAPGSGSFWGILAVVLWPVLLGLGLWGLFSIRQHSQLRSVLALTLLGQLALHTLYGDETFLYSLHFAPLLVVLAALSTLTLARPLALVLAGILVLSAGINNGLQLNQAVQFLQNHTPLRHLVQTQMQLRPTDPWSRGTGQVVLAVPDRREVDKAYHEPGGSFSPVAGSFGVSLWLTDAKGNLKTTSDDIPLGEIHQQFIQSDGQNVPGILTKTKYYQSLWSARGAGRWMLKLDTQPNENTKPLIVIRSVGPSDGRIRSLDWNGERLLINNRWFVTLTPAPTAVHLGEEGPKGWMTERSTITNWQGENGWGYTRFELGDRRDWKVVIRDSFSAT
jgi:hypothetical protein